MGSDLNVIQAAVILALAVVGTLLNRAGDTGILVTVHHADLLYHGFLYSMPGIPKDMQET